MMESTDYFIPTIIIQPKENGPHAQESLCHTVGMVLNVLQNNHILHNVLISEGGNTIFIIPRKEDPNERFGTAIFDLAGLFRCSTQEDSLKVGYKDYQNYVKNGIAFSKEEFALLKKMIMSAIDSEYQGKTH